MSVRKTQSSQATCETQDPPRRVELSYRAVFSQVDFVCFWNTLLCANVVTKIKSQPAWNIFAPHRIDLLIVGWIFDTLRTIFHGTILSVQMFLPAELKNPNLFTNILFWYTQITKSRFQNVRKNQQLCLAPLPCFFEIFNRNFKNTYFEKKTRREVPPSLQIQV